MSHAEISANLAENEHSHDLKAAAIDIDISSYSSWIMIFRMVWMTFSPESLHSSAGVLSRDSEHF